MSSRAACLKHRLSAASSLFLRSSNCIWGSTNKPIAQVLGREREAEAGKGHAKIYKSGWPDSFLMRTGKSCVIEMKLIENLQEKLKDVDFSHEPHLCTPRISSDDREYFSVFTLDQDLNFSPKYDMYPPVARDKLFFTSSCGGLFCYVSFKEGRVLLWNPTTHEYKLLPRPDSFVEPPPGVTENNHLYWQLLQGHGIFFDPQSQDHIVVLYYLLDIEDEDHDHIDLTFALELYSLRSKSWTKVPCPDYKCATSSHVCINGIFYTISFCKRSHAMVILSLNLSTKIFSSFPVAPVMIDQWLTLMEYSGLLSVLVPLSRNSNSFELWVMMNGSWVQESTFYTTGVYKPLCFWRNGELLFLHGLDEELLMFDRATGKLKHLGVHMVRGAQLCQFSEMCVELN